MASEKPNVTSKNTDLIPRIAVAVIGIPLLLSLSLYGPNWALWLAVLFAAVISAWEFLRMTLQRDFRADGTVGLIATVGVLLSLYWLDNPFLIAISIFASVIAIFTSALFTMQSHKDALTRIGAMFTTFTYIVVLFGAYTYLIKAPVLETGGLRTVPAPYQAGWFLLPMFIIWGGDTGAYFIGRRFGKRKLAPQISPAKSWEGAIAGLIASVLCAFLGYFVLPLPDMNGWLLIAIAIPAAILGQVGDLCISLVKRATGFKDSSSILYGHGGMLDRVDALIFAAPWILIARELWLPL